MASRAWKKVTDFEAQSCPSSGCTGKLTALYNVTMSAPWPWDQVGFTKLTVRASAVGIVAVAWDQAIPFCPACGWHAADHGESLKSDVILRLMRELILRGASASDVQQLVGNTVSTIDVLAATHPGLTESE